jgi:hypothetical protein
MLNYSIETRIQKPAGEKTDIGQPIVAGFSNAPSNDPAAKKQAFSIVRRTVGNLKADWPMTVAQIKSALKTETGIPADQIESEKFEGENEFTDNNAVIQPQKWLLYTITLKK